MARKLYSNRGQEIAAQLAIQTRIEQRFAIAYRKNLLQSYSDCAAAISSVGISALDHAVAINSDSLESILKANMNTAAETFSKRLQSNVKSFYPKYRKEFGITFDERLQMFVAKYIGEKIALVSETTKNQVKHITRIGLEDGLTLDQIAKQIRSNAHYMSATRAHIIARTETHTAANAGLQFESEVSEFEMQKEWLSVSDDRTRELPDDAFDHSAMNNEIVSINESFTVSGKFLSEDVLYPGDPEGSAGNIINCRCCQGNIIV